jgi:hypothetical protein
LRAKSEPDVVAVAPSGSRPLSPGGIGRQRTFRIAGARPFRVGLPLYSQSHLIIRPPRAAVKGRGLKKTPPLKRREAPHEGRLRFSTLGDETELTSSVPASSSCPDIRMFRTWLALSQQVPVTPSSSKYIGTPALAASTFLILHSDFAFLALRPPPRYHGRSGKRCPKGSV